MALTPEAIVRAARDILDEFGMADLSMRRVAGVLDVKAGALYWHFPNKQSLLAALADEILAGLETRDDGAPVAEWLPGWAVGLRRLLLGSRDAAELVASVRAMGLGEVDPCAAGRAALEAEGLGADDADATMQAFLHFVLGHVTEEQTQQQLAALGVLPEADAGRSQRHFEHGLGLLLAGLRATLPTQMA